MANSINPYYFSADIHSAALDAVVAGISGSPTTDEVCNLIYDFFVNLKGTNPYFYDFDWNLKVSLAATANQVLNGTELNSSQIPESFRTILSAFSNPFDNESAVAAMANSLAVNLFESDISIENKVEQLIGLSVYPSSVTYWKTVRDTPTNAWYIWIETNYGATALTKINWKEVAHADIGGGIFGLLLGKLGFGLSQDQVVRAALGGCIAASVVNLLDQADIL